MNATDAIGTVKSQMNFGVAEPTADQVPSKFEYEPPAILATIEQERLAGSVPEDLRPHVHAIQHS